MTRADAKAISLRCQSKIIKEASEDHYVHNLLNRGWKVVDVRDAGETPGGQFFQVVLVNANRVTHAMTFVPDPNHHAVLQCTWA